LANHSAMAIQNLKLQENLRESKELESFHKFSSFVVHDLRNTVSILSMLSENARENMDNPDFRKDLIKTLSGSVDNMQGLLSRISMRSNHSRVLLEEIDLCELISKSVEDIKLSSEFKIKFKFRKIPKLLSDLSQFKKVIVNLVLNAKDAMPNGGQILIKASKGKANALPVNIRSNWLPPAFVEISIADNGCGMTEDFINNSLFRPFRTTKDNGLGIGLYHCKEIVETLGGRIWVQSTVGSGSTFYVGLPIKEDLTRSEFPSPANLKWNALMTN